MNGECGGLYIFEWIVCLLDLFIFLFFIGLDSEGIYRILGFVDDVEVLKNFFDKGKLFVLIIIEI